MGIQWILTITILFLRHVHRLVMMAITVTVWGMGMSSVSMFMPMDDIDMVIVLNLNRHKRPRHIDKKSGHHQKGSQSLSKNGRKGSQHIGTYEKTPLCQRFSP